MNDLVDTGKPVYVAYQYIDYEDFVCTLENDPSNQTIIQKEMKNLQAYLSQFTIVAGLVVTIDFQVDYYTFTLCLSNI